MEDNQQLVALAIEFDRLDDVRTIIEQHHYDPASESNRAIRDASAQGRLDIVMYLLTLPTVDPSDEENDAIKLAVLNGHHDVANELLKDKRVDPSATNNWALVTAAYDGNLDAVNWLLGQERVMNAGTGEALEAAKSQGRWSVVTAIINAGTTKGLLSYCSGCHLRATVAASASAAN